MPHVPLRHLGNVGLISDVPTYDLPDNAFSDVLNVRFFNGTAQKTSIASDRYAINAGAVWMEIYLQSGVPQYTYADSDKLYERQGGSFVDVSNVSTYTASDLWRSMVWSEFPLYNNGIEVPQIKRDTDPTFIDLPNWPVGLQCKIIKPFKNFMVALNITDAGTEKPDFLQWSNEAEPGAVPDSWVPLPTNLAGGNLLSSEDGEIVDGLELGDVFIVYTRRSSYEMSFIGGDLVMGFRKFTDNGLANNFCVAAYDHYHFCVGISTIYIHDGHSVTHIADQKVRDFLFGSVTNTDSIKVAHIATTKEIFIYFEADGSNTGVATKALIWCYRYDTWTFIDLPGVNRVQFDVEQSIAETYADAAAAGTTYAQEARTYSQILDLSLSAAIYFLGTTDSQLYNYDKEFGSSLTYKIERTGLDFDTTLQLTTNTVKYIDQLLPQITGTGDIDITLGFSDTPEGVVIWGDPVTYNIETDYKIDVRNSGRYPAWRFEGSGDGNFKLSGLDFNVTVDGER